MNSQTSTNGCSEPSNEVDETELIEFDSSNDQLESILFLKGVDPNEVLDKYRNGGYMKEILNETKIKISPNRNSGSLFGDTSDANIYLFKINAVESRTLATVNCSAYTMFNLNGSLPKERKCNWCWELSKTGGGIPLRVSEINGVLIVEIDGWYNTFECCLADLRLRRGLTWQKSKFNYLDAETNLFFLFSLAYPNRTLDEAKDNHLHENLDGPLKSIEFHSKSHAFVELDGMIVVPIKRVYAIINQKY
jgi:hypothetical protein